MARGGGAGAEPVEGDFTEGGAKRCLGGTAIQTMRKKARRIAGLEAEVLFFGADLRDATGVGVATGRLRVGP